MSCGVSVRWINTRDNNSTREEKGRRFERWEKGLFEHTEGRRRTCWHWLEWYGWTRLLEWFVVEWWPAAGSIHLHEVIDSNEQCPHFCSKRQWRHHRIKVWSMKKDQDFVLSFSRLFPFSRESQLVFIELLPRDVECSMDQTDERESVYCSIRLDTYNLSSPLTAPMKCQWAIVSLSKMSPRCSCCCFCTCRYCHVRLCVSKLIV